MPEKLLLSAALLTESSASQFDEHLQLTIVLLDEVALGKASNWCVARRHNEAVYHKAIGGWQHLTPSTTTCLLCPQRTQVPVDCHAAKHSVHSCLL